MKSATANGCERPRCRGAAHVRYIGRLLCAKCWLEFCKLGLKTEDLPRFLGEERTTEKGATK